MPHFFLRNSLSFFLPYERKFSRNFLFAENPLINETLRRESFMNNENEKNLLRNIFFQKFFFSVFYFSLYLTCAAESKRLKLIIYLTWLRITDCTWLHTTFQIYLIFYPFMFKGIVYVNFKRHFKKNNSLYP